jgi:REase_DpnII-MboI
VKPYGLYAFNLDEPTLRSRFLEPYGEGRTIVIEGTAVSPDHIESIRVTRGSQAIQRATDDTQEKKYKLWSAEHEVTDDVITAGPGSSAAAPTPGAAPESTALDRVVDICRHFHHTARILRNRRDTRPALAMNDEYDVQYLLHGLLVNQFDDIRSEDWAPNYAGGASRMDFLLHAEEIVVEAKMTRSTLGAREVGEQLIVDIVKYAEHPRCKHLVCFVYDPGHEIANPAALETDLGSDGDPVVRVVVSPRL